MSIPTPRQRLDNLKCTDAQLTFDTSSGAIMNTSDTQQWSQKMNIYLTREITYAFTWRGSERDSVTFCGDLRLSLFFCGARYAASLCVLPILHNWSIFGIYHSDESVMLQL